MTVKTLQIHKSFYWTAGRKFGWATDGLEMAGVGINRSLLFGCDALTVKVGGKEYTLNCAEARDFVNKYQSFEKMAGGSVICVVSKTLLEEIV